MKKIKPLVLVVAIVAFLMIFLFGRKAYGNMTDTAIESSETAEEKAESMESAKEKDELGDEKMNEPATGGGTANAANMTDTAIESSETAEEKIEVVNKKMSETLASDRYCEMSLSERRELASGILLQLEQDGYITELLYNEDSFMYSFEYIDGTLGGWSIKDFSVQDDLLPMN